MNYRRIAGVLGFVVLLVLVTPFLVYAVPGAIGADHSFVVLSGSMEPELSPGDVVIVEETDPAAVETGDVVTFVREGEGAPVTHRVIGVEERNGNVAFETQGDANPEPDSGLVPGENLVGAVVLTIPLIGYVIQFGSTTEGLVLLVGLPIGLLVLSELWAVMSAVKDDSSPDGATRSDSGSAEGNAASTEAEDEISVHVTDLMTTLGVLALVAPYTIYVALQLQTTVAITAAFAASLSALGLGAVWLSARLTGDRGGKPTAADPSSETPDAATPKAGSEPALEPGRSDSVGERAVTVSPESETGVSLENGSSEPIAGTAAHRAEPASGGDSDNQEGERE